jgi:hypothetical protein
MALALSTVRALDHTHDLRDRSMVWGTRSSTSTASRDAGLAQSRDPPILVWAETRGENTNIPNVSSRVPDSLSCTIFIPISWCHARSAVPIPDRGEAIETAKTLLLLFAMSNGELNVGLKPAAAR